jgi:anaerobic C4-dicarboxylate transporter
MQPKFVSKLRWAIPSTLLLLAIVVTCSYRYQAKKQLAQERAYRRQLEAQMLWNQAVREQQAVRHYQQVQSESFRLQRVAQARRQASAAALQAAESAGRNWESATGADLRAMGVQ